MKKKLLGIGLLLSVMCMFSSCLLVVNEEKKDYSKNLVISNDFYEKAKIANVSYKYTEDIPGFENNWETAYTDGYNYTTSVDTINRSSRYSNKSISVDLPTGDYFDIRVMVVFPDEGSSKAYGTYEYYYRDRVYISDKKITELSLSDNGDFYTKY